MFECERRLNIPKVQSKNDRRYRVLEMCSRVNDFDRINFDRFSPNVRKMYFSKLYMEKGKEKSNY